MSLKPPAAVPTDQREFNAWCRQTFMTELLSGNGSPEGVVIADIGTLYLRKDGGAGTVLYVKESGNGLDTGWAAK